jgi:hypothetical protein
MLGTIDIHTGQRSSANPIRAWLCILNDHEKQAGHARDKRDPIEPRGVPRQQPAVRRWRSGRARPEQFVAAPSQDRASTFIGPGWLPEQSGSLHKAGSTRMSQTSTTTAGIDTSKGKLDIATMPELDVEQFLAIRKSEALKINPRTADATWLMPTSATVTGFAMIFSPETCSGRAYYARAPGSDIWVCLATCRAKFVRHCERLIVVSLLFPLACPQTARLC